MAVAPPPFLPRAGSRRGPGWGQASPLVPNFMHANRSIDPTSPIQSVDFGRDVPENSPIGQPHARPRAAPHAFRSKEAEHTSGERRVEQRSSWRPGSTVARAFILARSAPPVPRPFSLAPSNPSALVQSKGPPAPQSPRPASSRRRPHSNNEAAGGRTNGPKPFTAHLCVDRDDLSSSMIGSPTPTRRPDPTHPPFLFPPQASQ